MTADAALSSTPFPATCQHRAARLVNGARPWTDTSEGFASVDPESLVLGDLTGDGVDDAALAGSCSAGGVGWGGIVMVLTMSSAGQVQLLGTFFPTDLKAPGIVGDRPSIGGLHFDSGAISLQVKTQMANDASCCPSLPVDATLVVRDGRVQVEDVHPRLDEGTSSMALAQGTGADLFGQAGELAAVVQQNTVSPALAEIIQAYSDSVVEAAVKGCFSRLSEVPWHPGPGALSSLGVEESARFCVAKSPESDEAMVMAVAQRSPERWTVVAAATGTA